MNDKRPASPSAIAACIAVFLLIVIALVMGVYVSNLNAQVQHELSLTPTPVPAYPGSVMQITPDPSLPTRGPLLRTGSTGEQVKQLQSRLIELGYLGGTADGQFGPATENAVRLFQQQHGLDVDGKVGPETSALLTGSSAKPFVVTPTPAPTPTPTPAASASDTEKLQARLKELGYYTGQVDGLTGPATKAAIRLFQQRNGLDADGVVGPATSRVLYSDAAKPFTTPAPGSEPWVRQDGLPLLVNADNHMPATYQTSDLVLMRSYCDSSIVTIKGSEIEGERIATDALMTMIRAARADGHKGWQVNAGYRSIAYQQELFDDYVYRYRQDGMTKSEAIARTRLTVADPGASEHHTGLAFDLAITGEPSFGATKQSVWLSQHCWEYGFIIRYPADKVSITGISHEPWHVRYVGVEHSTRMRDEGLCLEEYIEKYGN